MFNRSLTFLTKGYLEFIDITEKVREVAVCSQVRNGLVQVFAPHATGILILTENEPCLLQDIRALLQNLTPRNGSYSHMVNAYAHLRSVLLPPEKTLPLVDGQIPFGTWQSLMFVETDVRPRERKVIVQILGLI